MALFLLLAHKSLLVFLEPFVLPEIKFTSDCPWFIHLLGVCRCYRSGISRLVDRTYLLSTFALFAALN